MPKVKEDKAVVLARKLVTDRLFSTPKETMETIFEHVANGGSTLDLAEAWGIRYSELCLFVNQDKGRTEMLKEAYQARNEWMREKILREVQRLATTDIRELYTDDGILKPISEWPADVAAAVSSFETDEIYEKVGRESVHVGDRKKLRLSDKLKALELLGKGQGMFAQKVEVTGKLSYEQFMATTYITNPPPALPLKKEEDDEHNDE
jgi:hypothetical protein